MALNNEFKVKNDLNTLGRILSGGTDIAQIFAASNTTWTLSTNNGTFGVAGGDALQVLGGNGVDVRIATGTDTVRVSGIDATTSVKGVASFNSASFAVTNGDVTVKSGGISNAQLSGSITDDKLNTISTAGKVANTATTATSANTPNTIVLRDNSGGFNVGAINASGTVATPTLSTPGGTSTQWNSTFTTVQTNSGNWQNAYNNGTAYQSTSSTFATNTGVATVTATLLPTSIYQGASGNWQNTFTNVQSNSANWQSAFNIGTAYQSASSTFATNTLLQTTSGLLTPLTTTRTLTGLLVLNTNFESYRTDVATATGTLLPTSIYRAASGNWQGTFTNVQSNSANWQSAYNIATVYQAASGSAATLTTTRTLWGQNFNGSQNVSGTLSAVGDIIGSGTITLTAGPGNNNINLRPSGTGLVTVTGNLSASNRVTARDVTATNLLSTANTFTRQLSVGGVQVKTVGTSNVFIGDSTTGNDSTTGSHNLVFGANAGSNTNGYHNNFLGKEAGRNNTNGSNNNFLGYCAGLNNTSGTSNNFFGERAGCANTGGHCNNFFGRGAGTANTYGHYNNFFGQNAGGSNTTGSSNNFIGNLAGAFNTTGSRNNFLGALAGSSNTIGSSNNFSGYRAGLSNTTGSLNNFLGYRAGGSNTYGASNNFIGRFAGFTNATGSNNTIIGNQADVATDSLSGVIVLGTGAIATESHQIVLSTANVSFRNIGSTFEIGTPSLTDNLTVYGAVSSTGIVNTNTGFRISNGATTGHVLRGDGTNFVSSTLAAADIASGRPLTETDDTNITLTLSGTPNSALLAAVNITAGWAGQLAVNRGGTGTSNGSITGNSTLTFTATGSNNIDLVTSTGEVNIDKVDINGGTIDGVTIGTSTVATSISSALLDVDNIRIDGNTISSTNSNGDITLTPNGIGDVSIAADTLKIGDTNPVKFTTNGAATLTIDTNGGTNSGIIQIVQGVNGDINLTPNGTGEVNIPKVDIDGGRIDDTPIGLTTPASGVFTGISVVGNVSIGGNLFISGSSTQVNTTDLVVRDPIIFLAEGNLNDTVDIGFTAAYDHGQPTKRHTGLIRNNVGGEWTLFSNLSSEILSAVQIPLDNPSLVVDTLNANIKGNVQGTLTGNVSGTAARADRLVAGKTISTTGDITYTSGSFDGTSNVTGTATISSNVVSYSKIQQVGANKILGNPTGSTANVSEIDCTSFGRALLSAASITAQRNTLGIGPSDTVTFGEVIVNNGTRSALRDIFAQSVTSTNVLTLSTFAKADYNSAKLTVQIKQGTTRRCVLEILATNDNGAWEGTVYGIVDPANIFLNVNVASTGSTVEFPFTFNGNANYTVTASVEAISD